MSAEPIATAVADLRAGRRVRNGAGGPAAGAVFDLAIGLVRKPVVVDATTIFTSVLEANRSIALYEDHPCIAPPWDEAAICYVNTFGNVVILHANVRPVFAGARPGTPPWEPAATVDWSRVRWRLDTFVWMGGHSTTTARDVPLTGPVHLFQYAIYDDGEPADLHWAQLRPDVDLDFWTNEQLVLLGTLNFMACRNVELVEPERPRPERRRIARTGVKVHTLNVYPTGKATTGPGGERKGGSPLTSVRGHFAHFGPQYGRKLLFGKYEGKFWIPQHARGDLEVGESKTDYRLRADVEDPSG